MREYEKIIKQRLSQAESPYPTDLWSKISNDLDKKKDKKKPIFPWLILSSLISICVIGVAVLINTNNKQTVRTDNAAPQVASLTPSEDELTTLSNEKSNPDQIKTTLTLSDSPSISNDTERNGAIFKANTSNLIANDLVASETLNPQPQDNGQRMESNYVYNTPSSKYPAFADNNDDEEIIDDIPMMSWIEDKDQKKHTDLEASKSFRTHSIKLPKIKAKATKLNVLEHKEHAVVFSQADIPVDDIILKRNRNNNANDCHGLDIRRDGWFLEPYFGSDYGIRSFKAKNTSSQAYAEVRENSESAAYSYSFGARAKYLSPNSWFIKGGLQFSQINEVMKYTDPEAVRYQTVIKIDSMLVENEWLTTRDTTQVPISGIESSEIINRYKTFDIPVSAGYEWTINRKWSVYGQAGAIINVLFSQRGMYIPQDETEPIWFGSTSQGDESIYKTNLGVSLSGALGLTYHWTDELRIFVEPNFRYFSKSITTEAYPLKQSYTTVGLATGIQIQF